MKLYVLSNITETHKFTAMARKTDMKGKLYLDQAKAYFNSDTFTYFENKQTTATTTKQIQDSNSV